MFILRGCTSLDLYWPPHIAFLVDPAASSLLLLHISAFPSTFVASVLCGTNKGMLILTNM